MQWYMKPFFFLSFSKGRGKKMKKGNEKSSAWGENITEGKKGGEEKKRIWLEKKEKREDKRREGA